MTINERGVDVILRSLGSGIRNFILIVMGANSSGYKIFFAVVWSAVIIQLLEMTWYTCDKLWTLFRNHYILRLRSEPVSTSSSGDREPVSTSSLSDREPLNVSDR